MVVVVLVEGDVVMMEVVFVLEIVKDVVVEFEGVGYGNGNVVFYLGG